MGPWWVNPDPNGPVKIRSPGRWPDTARSAAQVSEDRVSSPATINPTFGPCRNRVSGVHDPGRTASERLSAGWMVAIVAQPPSGAWAALRAVSGQRPGLRIVTKRPQIGMNQPEASNRYRPIGIGINQPTANRNATGRWRFCFGQSTIRSPVRATPPRPTPGAGQNGRRGAAAVPSVAPPAHRRRWRGCTGSGRRGTGRSRYRR